MRWLVDGYNVIRRDPALSSREREGLEAGRVALLHLLAVVAQTSPDTFTVVFDGARRTGGMASGGRIEVIFSRPPDRADDVLVRLAARWRDGAVVVTSDRAVRDAVRRAGAAVLGAEEFLAAVASPPAEDVGDDDGEPGRREKRGNPRRTSKAARAAARARRRLHR
jgi:predicted RNA-binding protein with PIN domain